MWGQKELFQLKVSLQGLSLRWLTLKLLHNILPRAAIQPSEAPFTSFGGPEAGDRCAQVKYETALGAVFVEGWIFVFLTLTGIRLRIVKLVPRSIMLATSTGAIPFQGFQYRGLDLF